MGRRFLCLWLLTQHQKFSEHFELPICGCEMWPMHLLSQCLFDHGSLDMDMMHTSSVKVGFVGDGTGVSWIGRYGASISSLLSSR